MHHLLGRKKPTDASAAVLGMLAPTRGISTPSKKVYWTSEHSRREWVLRAWPGDLAFCLLEIGFT